MPKQPIEYRWISTPKLKFSIGIDEDGRIVEAPESVKEFRGMQLWLLRRWLDSQGTFHEEIQS